MPSQRLALEIRHTSPRSPGYLARHVWNWFYDFANSPRKALSPRGKHTSLLSQAAASSEMARLDFTPSKDNPYKAIWYKDELATIGLWHRPNGSSALAVLPEAGQRVSFLVKGPRGCSVSTLAYPPRVDRLLGESGIRNEPKAHALHNAVLDLKEGMELLILLHSPKGTKGGHVFHVKVVPSKA